MYLGYRRTGLSWSRVTILVTISSPIRDCLKQSWASLLPLVSSGQSVPISKEFLRKEQRGRRKVAPISRSFRKRSEREKIMIELMEYGGAKTLFQELDRLAASHLGIENAKVNNTAKENVKRTFLSTSPSSYPSFFSQHHHPSHLRRRTLCCFRRGYRYIQNRRKFRIRPGLPASNRVL